MSRATNKDALLSESGLAISTATFVDFTDSMNDSFAAAVWPNMFSFEFSPSVDIGLWALSDDFDKQRSLQHLFDSGLIYQFYPYNDPKMIRQQLSCQFSANELLAYYSSPWHIASQTSHNSPFHPNPLAGDFSKLNYEKAWRNFMVYALKQSSDIAYGIYNYAPLADNSKNDISDLQSFSMQSRISQMSALCLSDYIEAIRNWSGDYDTLSGAYHICAYDWEKLFPSGYSRIKNWTDYTKLLQDLFEMGQTSFSGDMPCDLSALVQPLGKAYENLQTVKEGKTRTITDQQYGTNEVKYVDLATCPYGVHPPYIQTCRYAWTNPPSVNSSGTIELSGSNSQMTPYRLSLYNYQNLLDWYYTYILCNNGLYSAVNRWARVPWNWECNHKRLEESHTAQVYIMLSVDWTSISANYDGLSVNGYGEYKLIPTDTSSAYQYVLENKIEIHREQNCDTNVDYPAVNADGQFGLSNIWFYYDVSADTVRDKVHYSDDPDYFRWMNTEKSTYPWVGTYDEFQLAETMFPELPETRRAKDLSTAQLELESLESQLAELSARMEQEKEQYVSLIDNRTQGYWKSWITEVECNGSYYNLTTPGITAAIEANDFATALALLRARLKELSGEPDQVVQQSIQALYNNIQADIQRDQDIANWRSQLQEIEDYYRPQIQSLQQQIAQKEQEIEEIRTRAYDVILPDMDLIRHYIARRSYCYDEQLYEDFPVERFVLADYETPNQDTKTSSPHLSRLVFGPFELSNTLQPEVEAYHSNNLIKRTDAVDWPSEKLAYGFKRAGANNYVFSHIDYLRTDVSAELSARFTSLSTGCVDSLEGLGKKNVFYSLSSVWQPMVYDAIESLIPEYSNGLKTFKGIEPISFQQYERQLTQEWMKLTDSHITRPSLWCGVCYDESHQIMSCSYEGQPRALLSVYYGGNVFTNEDFAKAHTELILSPETHTCSFEYKPDGIEAFLTSIPSCFYEPDIAYDMALSCQDTTIKSMTMDM